MINSKSNDRSSWVVQREYQDAQGITQTEYRDSSGNIHTEVKDVNTQAKSYESGYANGVLMEGNSQNERLKREEVADRKVSRGLLVGLIIAGVVGISGAMAYYLFEANRPEPTTVVTTPIYQTDTDKTDPDLEPDNSPTVVEKSVTNNITQAPPPEAEAETEAKAESEPQDVNVNITTESAAPTPVAPPKAQPKAEVAQPTKTATPAPKAPVKPTPALTPTASQAKPIAPMAPVPPTSANSNNAPSPAKTDGQLKGEIVKEFNKQFSNNQLSVDVSQGNVKVSGTVASSEQLSEIQPLLRSVEGVKTIDVKVTSKMSTN